MNRPPTSYPPEWQDYVPIRRLPNGEWAGIRTFMFTAGLCIGLDLTGYRGRWCYSTRLQAELALSLWDGVGDPPGNWIKFKGRDATGHYVEYTRLNLMVVDKT